MEYIIISIYLVFLIYAIGKIFRYVRNPAKTLLWLVVVIGIPFIGLLFYLLIGKSPKKDKYFKQKSPFYAAANDEIRSELLPKSKHRLIGLMSQNKSAALSYGNRITVLQDGEETFEHIFQAMRQAKSSIHLDFYILEAGETLDECIRICKDRVSAGVKVKLIYDGFGTFGLSRTYIDNLVGAGVESKEFFPFHLYNLFKFINYRNHRKIVIVDNHIAFTGGMNISDKYTIPHIRLGLWRDTFIKIEGPAARHFEQVFQSDWHYAKGAPYKLANQPVKVYDDGAAVQVIASGPDSEYEGIMQEYFTIITDAEEYVYLVTPYFVPGEALMTALKTSALSNIDVRIMLPFDSDSKWMRWCMFSYFDELLSAGVKMYLYHDGFLHGKVIISDDLVSSIGTANIDDRSFEANFEVNALVYDRETAFNLKGQFFIDMQHCEEVTLADFLKRRDRNRIMESVARITSSML